LEQRVKFKSIKPYQQAAIKRNKKGFYKVLFCKILPNLDKFAKKFHFMLAKKLKFCYNARVEQMKI